MKTRIPFDAYYTNCKLIEQLLLKYPISKNKVILEPCNGKGHISSYLIKQGYEVITNDIDTNTVSDYYYDFTSTNVDYKYKLASNCDIVITNPPFNVANKILENCLDIVDEVIMLLRLSFLEGTKDRRALLNKYKDNLVKMITINPRPKFREDTSNTDSVCPVWLIYNKNHSWKDLNIQCPIDLITDWA